MKILKFSGIVAGVHLLALILIFANPGCSSSTKPAPTPSETATVEPAPPISLSLPPAGANDGGSAPIAFNPAGASARYNPTRPGTPVASSLQTEPVAQVTPATTYTVVSGDNLSAIAKKNHLTVAELAVANNLIASTAKIRPGQKLIIPGKSEGQGKPLDMTVAPTEKPIATPATAKTPGDSVTHTVQPGETLSVIARRYGVKQADIAVANSISDPKKLAAGKVLTIPGWQLPPGQNSKPVATGANRTGGEMRPAAPPENSGAPMKPASPPEVPVIRVEEAPAPGTP